MLTEIRNLNFYIVIGKDKQKRHELLDIIHKVGIPCYEIADPKLIVCRCKCVNVNQEQYEALSIELKKSRRYWRLIWM